MLGKHSLVFVLLLCSSFAPIVSAVPDVKEADLDELLELDFQKLMNVKISIVSRTEESQFSAAAAVFVLTSEDIKRSGHRRIPEILRMVPGFHTGKIDANKWSISSRNNFSRFTSTMLVMIDGRTIYTPLYGGVYWEIHDTFIEDIERIEVVRGPGATVWGANAVDGVINIITKSSSKTQGWLSYAGVGVGEMKAEAGTRYGGKFGDNGSYRLYAKGYGTDTGQYLGPNESTNAGYAPIGADANDDGLSGQMGYRADWTSGRDQFSLQGDLFRSKFNEDRIVNSTLTPNQINWSGQNILFHWKRDLSESDSSQFKAFYNATQRDDDIINGTEDLWELDYQRTLNRGRHSLVYGLGYRNFDDTTTIPDPLACAPATPCFGLDPTSNSLATFSAFIQDRFSLSDSTAIIFGSKFEQNGYTGFEYQPTARVSWTPDDHRTLWGAITRSIRTPTRVDRDGILDFGGFVVPIGDKNAESNIIFTYETGYRHRFGSKLILDGSLFYSDYQNTLQGTPPPTRGKDAIYGFDGYLKHKPVKNWSWEAGYAYHRGNYVLSAGGTEPMEFLPAHTLNLAFKWDISAKTNFDTYVYYVSGYGQTIQYTDYARVDMRWSHRVRKNIETSIRITNMLDDAHPETADTFKINSGVKRGIEFRVVIDN